MGDFGANAIGLIIYMAFKILTIFAIPLFLLAILLVLISNKGKRDG